MFSDLKRTVLVFKCTDISNMYIKSFRLWVYWHQHHALTQFNLRLQVYSYQQHALTQTSATCFDMDISNTLWHRHQQHVLTWISTTCFDTDISNMFWHGHQQHVFDMDISSMFWHRHQQHILTQTSVTCFDMDISSMVSYRHQQHVFTQTSATCFNTDTSNMLWHRHQQPVLTRASATCFDTDISNRFWHRHQQQILTLFQTAPHQHGEESDLLHPPAEVRWGTRSNSWWITPQAFRQRPQKCPAIQISTARIPECKGGTDSRGGRPSGGFKQWGNRRRQGHGQNRACSKHGRKRSGSWDIATVINACRENKTPGWVGARW